MIRRRLTCRTGVGYPARQLFRKLHDQRERVGARRAVMDDLYVGKERIVDENDLVERLALAFG